MCHFVGSPGAQRSIYRAWQGEGGIPNECLVGGMRWCRGVRGPGSVDTDHCPLWGPGPDPSSERRRLVVRPREGDTLLTSPSLPAPQPPP